MILSKLFLQNHFRGKMKIYFLRRIKFTEYYATLVNQVVTNYKFY